METLTAAALETAINETVKGNTFVSVLSETPVRMVKKSRETGEPNPYLGAIKRQKKNGAIGFDYASSVNRQAAREGKEERETHSRTWGILSDNRLFVHHKGNTYVQLKLQSTGDTEYILDGKTIPYEAIKPYLSKSSKSSTQADIEKQVVINDIKMDNVKAITMNGKTFMVVPEMEAVEVVQKVEKDEVKTESEVTA